MSKPSEFPTVQLEDVVEVLDHLRVPVNSAERLGRTGVVPYYGANGLQGWIDKPLFDEPLILLAEDGGNFEDFASRPIAYRIEGPSWVNNHAHIIRAKAGICQSYIFWSLVNKDIRRFIAGGTRTKLTQGELRRIEISLPDAKEQRAIAQVLDTLDTAIRETEALIDKLKAVKQGLLHDLLTRGIDANGQLRPPQSEAPQLYKESPLGWVPRDWEVKRLDEYCMLVADGTHDSPKPAEKGYPLVTSKNLRDGQLDFSGSYLISETDYHAVRVRSMVEAGDILFGMIGTIGNPVIIEEGQDQIATKNIGLLRLNGNFCKGRFLKDWLSSSAVERQLNEAMSGSTQRFIGLGTLRAILVAEPNALEMENIVEILKNLTTRIDADRQLLLKLTREKAGLMDDLLTGRVRVTRLLESVQQAAAQIVQQPVGQTGA